MDIHLFSQYEALFSHYNEIIAGMHSIQFDDPNNLDLFIRCNEVHN